MREVQREGAPGRGRATREDTNFRVWARFQKAIAGQLVRGLGASLNETAYAIHGLPVILAGLIAWALADLGQFHELYLATIEEVLFSGLGNSGRSWLKIALCAFALLLLSKAIYASNAILGRYSIENIFQEHHKDVVDGRLARRVKIVGLFAAGLPLIGMVCGIGVGINDAVTHIERVGLAPDRVEGKRPTGASQYFRSGVVVPPVEIGKVGDFYAFLKPADDWLGTFRLRPLRTDNDRTSRFWPAVGCWLLVSTGAFFLVRWSRERRRWFGGPSPKGAMDEGRRSRWSANALGRWVLSARRNGLAKTSGILGTLSTLLVFGSIFVPLAIERIIRGWDEGSDATPLTYSAGLGPYWPGWKALEGGTKDVPFLAWIDGPIALWALTCGILFCLYLFSRTQQQRIARRGSGERRYRIFLQGNATIIGFGFVFCVLSGFLEFQWVEIARAFGTLGMALVLCLVIVQLIGLLGRVSREMGVPLIVVLAGVAAIVVVNKLELGIGILLAIFGLAATGVAAMLSRRGTSAWIAMCLAVILVASFSKLRPGAQALEKPVAASSASQPDKLEAKYANVSTEFNKWYVARSAARVRYAQQNGNSPYPVFIIAAEGGGIYAAAAASGFLSRLQERCPGFAQHVFAISGVSGGAVGAAVFHGAVDEREPMLIAGDNCLVGATEPTPAGAWGTTLQGQVAEVVKQDHLSPLAGLVVPDVLGTYSDRAMGLKQSLEADMTKYLTPSVPLANRQAWLNSFVDHWEPNRPAPALVLNATWASVGNRTVFAPFNLEAREFLTLNDFALMGTRKSWSKDPLRVGLAEAAVISARFPGVVGAYEIKGHMAGDEDRRWYFVDGGYVDASGALTAHEIYRSVQETMKRKHMSREDGGRGRQLTEHWDVDLRLILLTSTQSNENEAGTKGAQLRDLVAPVEALFNVRSLLSRNAVRETIAKTDIEASETTPDLADRAQLGDPEGWKVTIVEINRQDFSLALGWKLSGLTYDMISLQLGQANLCEGASREARARRFAPPSPLRPAEVDKPTKRDPVLEVAKTIRANSCVMAAIEKLLQGRNSPLHP